MLSMHKQIVAARKAAEQERRQRTRYAVFEWTAENRYPADRALSKLYRRECDAVKACDRMASRNVVVREVYLDD